jgi:quinol monooxygenase YgiN
VSRGWARAGICRPYAGFVAGAAFDEHLAGAHFRAFDAAVRGMITAKSVRALQRVDPG